MRDGEIHLVALFGTTILSAALIIPTVWLTAAADSSDKPNLDNMTMIEASLAMKKTVKPVQPQKPVKDPEPTKPPEGVSHDADQKPIEEASCKVDKDCPANKTCSAGKCVAPKVAKTDDKPIDITKFKHALDDDSQVGKKVPVVGDLNGSEFGDSATSVGDPWLGKLKADMHYAPPEIAKGDSVPVGCILLDPDGKIKDARFKVKTDDDLQTAAEAALKQLTDARNAQPDPVPTHLLRLTEHYLCFKFTVKP